MEQLDKSQQAFCRSPVGNTRLLAPAGCGKTLSLLFRCNFLAEQSKNQRPRFLVVTFTVAAKQELISRLHDDPRFGHLHDTVEVTTLNSWGFRRIKNAAFSPKLITSKADYHFAMLNQLQPVWMNHERVRVAIEEKKNIVPRSLMKVIDSFKSLGFDHHRHKDQTSFIGRLSELRIQGLKWKLSEQVDELTKLGILEPSHDSDIDLYGSFFKFWLVATDHLINSATFTLEDQKYFAYLDERQKVEEGKLLAGVARYDHVLVDEFQDINPLDLGLVKAIVDRNRATLTIVGDDDQAIFEWRGATPEYILNPEKFFGSKFSTHTLGVNYRSPKNIVEHSHRLIAHNQRRVDKSIVAARKDNATIEIIETNGVTESLDVVYEVVKKAIGKGTSPSRVAIIGRKRAQIIPYQVFFASKDIAFCAAEDLQVFMSEAFERLLRLLMIKERAMMRQTKSQIVEELLELCNLVKRYPLSKKDRESLKSGLLKGSASKLIEGAAALIQYRGSLKGSNANGEMSLAMAHSILQFIGAKTVSDSLIALATHFEGLQMDLGKAEDDIFYTDPPFLQLADFASRYGDDYGQFVEDIERAKEQLAYVPPFEDDGSAASDELWKRPLHLMTAQRAKGKEFDIVVLLDVNEGVWPNKNARTPEQLEAERRVFYVAFTRAKSAVLMLVSKRFATKAATPSPYISELGLIVA